MKSFYIVLLAVVALLTGCDSVGSDERLIEVPAATVQRNVLIEDFTGQRCIFCPAASEAIAEQQKLYGADKLIAVAFHQDRLQSRVRLDLWVCAPMWEILIISIGQFQMCQKPLSIVVEVYFPKILGQDESMMSSLKQQP